MIYFQLFLTFFKIGLVSFGGGYGMISLIREEVLSFGWLTEEDFLSFLAVSESTPGPIAINMATFIGSSQAGIFGSFMATLGVILPSFIIILLIVIFINNLLKYASVNAVLLGIRPAVIGLIITTAITLLISSVLGVSNFGDALVFDWKGLIILCLLFILSFTYKKIRKKKFSPIILIVISGVLGLILY